MSNAVPDMAASYKVAYDESVRALSQQQTSIDSFRTRAGLLLSTAAITTSFLGAQALNDGHPGLATWLALTAFAAVSIAALSILWPHRWEFTADPEDLIEMYVEAEEPAPVSDIHRDLSLHMHRSYVANRRGREHLAMRFRLATAILTLEVFLWLVDLAASKT